LSGLRVSCAAVTLQYCGLMSQKKLRKTKPVAARKLKLFVQRIDNSWSVGCLLPPGVAAGRIPLANRDTQETTRAAARSGETPRDPERRVEFCRQISSASTRAVVVSTTMLSPPDERCC